MHGAVELVRARGRIDRVAHWDLVADHEHHVLGPAQDQPVRAGIPRRCVVEALASGEPLAASSTVLPGSVIGDRLALEVPDPDVVELGQLDPRDFTAAEREHGGLLRPWKA